MNLFGSQHGQIRLVAGYRGQDRGASGTLGRLPLGDIVQLSPVVLQCRFRFDPVVFGLFLFCLRLGHPLLRFRRAVALVSLDHRGRFILAGFCALQLLTHLVERALHLSLLLGQFRGLRDLLLAVPREVSGAGHQDQ